MHENNFEKQVQQKTDELRLTPSEDVWQKVAVAIGKGKSDRRMIAVFCLLLVLIGSSTFMIWHGVTGKKISKEISATKKIDKEIAATEASPEINKNKSKESTSAGNDRQTLTAPNNSTPSEKNTADKAVAIVKDSKTTKSSKHPQGHTTLIQRVFTTNAVAAAEPDKKNNEVENAGGLLPKDKNKISKTIKGKVKLSIANGNAAELPGEVVPGKITTTGNEVTVKKQITDTVSEDKVVVTTVNDTLATSIKKNNSKDIAVKKTGSLKQEPKWKLGINLSFGITGTRSGYFGIGPGSGNEEKALDYSQSPVNGNNGGGQSTYLYTPSAVKTGTGFLVGVFAEKNISAKTSLLVGVNYKTYSSALTIGERVDSLSILNLNYYYRSGSRSKYTNHFRFIELPVAIRYRLGKQNKFPVYLSAGFSVSRLIASNALQFEPFSGTYYSDNEQLHKTMVNISAGLLFSLTGNAKNPLLAGPDINFSINRMAGSGLYQNRRYSYFGIQVQKTFGKK